MLRQVASEISKLPEEIQRTIQEQVVCWNSRSYWCGNSSASYWKNHNEWIDNRSKKALAESARFAGVVAMFGDADIPALEVAAAETRGKDYGRYVHYVYSSRKRNLEEIGVRRTKLWDLFIKERGARYQNCTFDSYEATTDAQRNVVEALRGWDGKSNIVLYGPKGTGKDHLLCALFYRNCVRKEITWKNGSTLFQRVRSSFNDEYMSEGQVIDSLQKHEVLAISDPIPVSGALTQFQQDVLFRVLDYRYSHLLPTWATVNVASRTELDERLGAANADRLIDGALCLFCNWESHRRSQRKEIQP